MREELLGLPQKRVLRLHAPKLLQGERQDLRVREPLQRLVASGAGVEEAVGLVGEAEEHDHALFRVGEAWGEVDADHLSLLVVGSRMVPSLLLKPRNSHLAGLGGHGVGDARGSGNSIGTREPLVLRPPS